MVPDDGDRRGICAIAWTQGAVSTGMLAAGTTALFGGLGWMLASHAVNEVSEQNSADVRSLSFLADLGGWLTFASAMTMTLVLSETSIDYLHFMFGERPRLWVVGLITTSAALIIAVDCALVCLRTKSVRNWLLDKASPTQLALRSVKVATVGILILAIVGSWLTMSLARFPKDLPEAGGAPVEQGPDGGAGIVGSGLGWGEPEAEKDHVAGHVGDEDVAEQPKH